LMALMAVVVIAQGTMFAGLYSRGDGVFLDIHSNMGEISGIVVFVVGIPLAFLARFRKEWKIGWLTVILAVMWNIQAHVLGFGIEDVRWLEMIHIPVAFVIFGLALYLTGKTGRVFGRVLMGNLE